MPENSKMMGCVFSRISRVLCQARYSAARGDWWVYFQFVATVSRILSMERVGQFNFCARALARVVFPAFRFPMRRICWIGFGMIFSFFRVYFSV